MGENGEKFCEFCDFITRVAHELYRFPAPDRRKDLAQGRPCKTGRWTDFGSSKYWAADKRCAHFFFFFLWANVNILIHEMLRQKIQKQGKQDILSVPPPPASFDVGSDLDR